MRMNIIIFTNNGVRLFQTGFKYEMLLQKNKAIDLSF